MWRCFFLTLKPFSGLSGKLCLLWKLHGCTGSPSLWVRCSVDKKFAASRHNAGDDSEFEGWCYHLSSAVLGIDNMICQKFSCTDEPCRYLGLGCLDRSVCWPKCLIPQNGPLPMDFDDPKLLRYWYAEPCWKRLTQHIPSRKLTYALQMQLERCLCFPIGGTC